MINAEGTNELNVSVTDSNLKNMTPEEPVRKISQNSHTNEGNEGTKSAKVAEHVDTGD